MSKYAPKPKEMAAEMGADYLTKDLKGKENWMETVPQFKDGNWCYPPTPEVVESLGLPHGRKWSPIDEDWDLPENFKDS